MGSGASDPYTGEGRYTGGSSVPTRSQPIGDPFTGSGAYSTQSSSSVQPMDVQITPPSQSSYFPKVPILLIFFLLLFIFSFIQELRSLICSADT